MKCYEGKEWQRELKAQESTRWELLQKNIRRIVVDSSEKNRKRYLDKTGLGSPISSSRHPLVHGGAKQLLEFCPQRLVTID